MKRLVTAHLMRIVMTIVIGVFLTSQMVVAQAEGIIATAWSPDGSMIATSGTGGLLSIWDANTGSLITNITRLSGNVRSVSWSPDSTKIVSGGDDNIVHIWNAVTGQSLANLVGHTAGILFVDWSPDGSKIASVTADENLNLRTWDATSYQFIKTLRVGDVQAVKWSPNSSKLAIVNTNIGVIVLDATLNISTLDLVNYSVGPNSSIAGNAGSVAWRNDNNTIAIGYFDGKIYLWNVTTNQQVSVLQGHTGWVGSLSWSPDGTRLASASNDGTVRIWNVANGTVLATFQKGNGLTLSTAWSPDGTKLAYGGNDGTLQIVSVDDVLSATPAPTTTPTAQDLISVLKPAGCTTTCFIGIQPCVTTQSEVKAIFASRGVQYTIDAGINNDEPNGAYYWSMSTTGMNFSTDDGSTLLYGTVTFSKGIVRQLAVGLSIPVKTIVAAFGQPNELKTETIRMPRLSFWLILL